MRGRCCRYAYASARMRGLGCKCAADMHTCQGVFSLLSTMSRSESCRCEELWGRNADTDERK